MVGSRSGAASASARLAALLPALTTVLAVGWLAVLALTSEAGDRMRFNFGFTLVPGRAFIVGTRRSYPRDNLIAGREGALALRLSVVRGRAMKHDLAAAGRAVRVRAACLARGRQLFGRRMVAGHDHRKKDAGIDAGLENRRHRSDASVREDRRSCARSWNGDNAVCAAIGRIVVVQTGGLGCTCGQGTASQDGENHVLLH